MNIVPNVLIVSTFQKNVNPNTNVDNHIRWLKDLQNKGVPCMELKGRYNGDEELSIMVVGFENRTIVEDIAKVFNQECYLESHNDRSTSLVYPNGIRQSIGKLTNVSRQEAEAMGSYSYDPGTDQYFVTK